MAVTIVLATEDAELREHVELVVSEAADLDLLTAVTDLDRLSEALTSADVDVLLLDERMPRLSLRETVRDASIDNPFAAVVLLTPATGEQPAAERYAAALEAGARSTLAVPTSLDELRTRVQQAAEWSRSLRSHVGGSTAGRSATRGRLVAVTGAKGGVGTSVLACLLAREALSSTASVCLVDADLHGGSIGFYADVTARRDLADLAQVASDLTGRSIREVAVDHESGLVLVLAPEAVERGEELTGDVARAVFGHLRTHFDVVVVDCGADLDEARAMVLELADEVVLVTSTDVVALRAARATLATWERLAVRAPGAVRLVVNRASRKVEVQPDLVERVIGLPVASAVPAAFRALEAPLNSGRLLAEPPAALQPAVRELAVATGLAAAAPSGRGRKQRTTTAAAAPRPVRQPRAPRESRAARKQRAAAQQVHQAEPLLDPFAAPVHAPQGPPSAPVVPVAPVPAAPVPAQDPWAAPAGYGVPVPAAAPVPAAQAYGIPASAPVYGIPGPTAPVAPVAPVAPPAPPAQRAPRRQRVAEQSGLMGRLSAPSPHAAPVPSAGGYDDTDPLDRA